jgi:hypothetical protein
MIERGTFLGRAAALAAVGLLAACGGGGSKLATNHNRATSSTTKAPVGAGVSSAALDTSTTAATGSTSTVAAAASKGTASSTATGGAKTPAAPAGPPAGTGSAPLAGTYKYESTDDKGQVTQLSLKVKTNKTSGPVADQTLTISSPQGSEQNEYTWDPATGVTVSSTQLSGEQGSVTCTWKPGISQFVLPIHANSSWSSLSNCTTSLAGAPATASYSNKATVSGSQSIRVAGENLNTWVIHRTTVFKAKSATFDLTITTISVEYFDPSNGETPKETTDTTTAGSYEGRSFSQEAKATIQAVTLNPS